MAASMTDSRRIAKQQTSTGISVDGETIGRVKVWLRLAASG